MGWLNATVKKKDKRRADLYDKDDPFNRLPDVDDYAYIILLWNRAGMISRGGMSSAPLTWQELAAFSSFNNLTLFEAGVIIDMSRSFVEGLGMSDINDKAPYQTELTGDDWLARERSIEGLFEVQ